MTRFLLSLLFALITTYFYMVSLKTNRIESDYGTESVVLETMSDADVFAQNFSRIEEESAEVQVLSGESNVEVTPSKEEPIQQVDFSKSNVLQSNQEKTSLIFNYTRIFSRMVYVIPRKSLCVNDVSYGLPQLNIVSRIAHGNYFSTLCLWGRVVHCRARSPGLRAVFNYVKILRNDTT